jgi:hypothetical protein
LEHARRLGHDLASGAVPVTATALGQFRDAYLAALQPYSRGRTYVTDKMPHNFCYVGLIAKALPEARIIVVDRDSRAVCWSNYWQYFRKNVLGYACDLHLTVTYHGMYRDLMEFWDERFGDRLNAVGYESLTTDQDGQTRALLSRLGLPWNDACLRPQDNARQVTTSSVLQVRRPVYSGSSQEWRKFEPYLDGAFKDLQP